MTKQKKTMNKMSWFSKKYVNSSVYYTISLLSIRVYVNVLNYENAVITGSISNAVTASFAVTSSFAQTTPSGKSIALSFILG